MERYEVRLKFDQIKKMMDLEQYEEAMAIANTIDWDRSKNINMLCMAGEVYERCGYYEDSKAIYLRAYQLQPQSRIVIYRLAELSIKLRDYEDSIHFYKEYEDVAPYDVNLYVLRYKIYQARGASTETLISILEELKETDYHERWAYELAKLYAESGMVEKCVAECDEINLWFGDGRYVRKALQLKKRFQPLTKEQQQKLDDAQPRPHKAEETISRQTEAEQERMKAQQQFEDLRAQAEESGKQSGRTKADQDAQMEQARNAALNAAREAKAARLLQEAEEEKAAEEQQLDAREDEKFIGQEGIMPQLNIKIPEKLNPPVIEAPVQKPAVEGAKEYLPKPEEESPSAPAEEKKAASETYGKRPADSGLFTTLERQGEGQEKKKENDGPTESDILAENIALALGGKLPANQTRKPYEDDFIRMDQTDDFIREDINEIDTFMGDLESFRVKENAGPDHEPEDLSEEFSEEAPEAHEESEQEFEDDYERDNPPEDDSTPEDDASFAKKEGAFRRMWRMTSNAVSKKPKKATVIARQEDYDIQIKPVVVSRYDTINLQKELAKSIRAIMNATEKEEVEKTMQDINRSMEESNIPKLIQTKRLNIQAVQEAMAVEEAETAAAEGAKKETDDLENKVQKLLGEDYDGQIRLLVEEEKQAEKQITGQMRLDELLHAEYQKQLVEVKKKALEQAEEYIDQLSVVVPYIGDREEVQIEEEPSENTSRMLEQAQELMASRLESRSDLESVIEKLSDLLKDGGVPETKAPGNVEEEPEEQPAAEEVQEEEPEEPAVEEVREEEPEEPEEPAAEEVQEEELEEPAAEEVREEEPEEASEDETAIKDQQKQILSYFMKFSGVEEEISAFLEREKDESENLVITGTEGSGKTSLALRLIKSIARQNGDASRKVAKLTANIFNEKNVVAIFEKVGEGTLIIEHAEDLEDSSCDELAKMLEAYAKKVRVILIGEEAPVQQLLSDRQDLSAYFAYSFHLHEYNNNELVEFAKAYADTKGYKMDEMAVLALYTRLADAKTKKHAVMLGDVKEIVNRAIDVSESRKGVKNFFNNLLMKNVDQDGNLLLRESDFENS